MRRLETEKRSEAESLPYPVCSTPFPNVLLDEVMPTLKDTQWRVLCVVVRQTLGWSAGHGRRRARCWLSQSELKRRTGRQSEAVSKAIEYLVRRGLLEVATLRRDPLMTAAARRRCGGSVYYGLAPYSGRISNTTNRTQQKRAN